MPHKRLLMTTIGVMLAAAGLVLFAAACSNKKSNNNGADTPTTAATTPGETPQSTITPLAGETPQAGTVTVNLTEWKILPDTSSVPAGSVTFNVKNIGSEKHEFVVLKTELPEDGLPVKADGSADEAGAGVEIIDEVEELAAGDQGSVTANLVPGNYVLICNVVDTEMGHVHYKERMHTVFTVTP